MSIFRPRPGWTFFDELVNAILAALSRVPAPPAPTITTKETSPMVKLQAKVTPSTDPSVTTTVRVSADGKPVESLALTDGVAEIDAGEADTIVVVARNTNKYGKFADSAPITVNVGSLVPVPDAPGTPAVTFLDDTPDAPPLTDAAGATTSPA